MIRIGTGILAAAAWVMFLSLAKAAGRADRMLGEMQGPARGEAGGPDGN